MLPIRAARAVRFAHRACQPFTASTCLNANAHTRLCVHQPTTCITRYLDVAQPKNDGGYLDVDDEADDGGNGDEDEDEEDEAEEEAEQEAEEEAEEDGDEGGDEDGEEEVEDGEEDDDEDDGDM
jgi:hypothetical protein